MKSMASSGVQFSITSDGDDIDCKIPLAKLCSPVNLEVAEAKEEIHRLLLTSSKQCNAIISDLFGLYVKTNCRAAVEILLDQSQQNHVNFLFEKMNEGLKHRAKKYPTLMLLWSVIQRQPSWLHTIISAGFFNSFIKCLKIDEDIVVLMAGILIIASLLPSVPSLVGTMLTDFYDIFERIFLITAKKKGVASDTHLLHLKIGVNVYFHRLYSMYPNHTISFLKSFYESTHGKHGEEMHRSLEALLRWVKFHPWLVTETEETEIGKNRWRSKEAHDVVIDCEIISLEPRSVRLQESDHLSSVCTSRPNTYDVMASDSSGILSSSFNSAHQTAFGEEERLDIATQTGTSLQSVSYCSDQYSLDSGAEIGNCTPLVKSSAMLASPTALCSLSTPPSSKNTSPSGSILDISIGHTSIHQLNSLLLDGCSNVSQERPATPIHCQQKERKSIHTEGSKTFTPTDGVLCGQNTKIMNSRQLRVDDSTRCDPALHDPFEGHPSLHKQSGIKDESASIVSLGQPRLSNNQYAATNNEIVLHSYSFFDKNSLSLLSTVEKAKIVKSKEKASMDNMDFESKKTMNCEKTKVMNSEKMEEMNSEKTERMNYENTEGMNNEKMEGVNSENTERVNSEKTEGMNSEKTEGVKNEKMEGMNSEKMEGMNNEKTEGVNYEKIQQIDNKKTEGIDSEKMKGVNYEKRDALRVDLDKTVQSRGPHKEKSDTFCDAPSEKCAMPKAPLDLLETLRSFTMSVCRHCLGNCHGKKADPFEWERSLSPSQLLDQYLLLGASLQRGKLHSIPLVSQEGTEWTHFGGSAPNDEVNLLRRELLLIQSELMFERHKCDLHATRNRRLIGKAFQTNAVKEELAALKDQFKVQQKEVCVLKQSCKDKEKENRQLKEITDAWNKKQGERIRQLSETNKTLMMEKLRLAELVKHRRCENDKLLKDIKESKAKIFQLENDSSYLKIVENENAVLKSKANTQSMQLLLMGEREEHYKDAFQVLRSTVKRSPEDEKKLAIYEKNLEEARTLVNEHKAEISFLKSNILELETNLTKKDHQITDLKKSIESIKKIWKNKLDAVESKYETIKRSNQRLEAEVMSLQSKLEARIKGSDR